MAAAPGGVTCSRCGTPNRAGADLLRGVEGESAAAAEAIAAARQVLEELGDPYLRRLEDRGAAIAVTAGPPGRAAVGPGLSG